MQVKGPDVSDPVTGPISVTSKTYFQMIPGRKGVYIFKTECKRDAHVVRFHFQENNDY